MSQPERTYPGEMAGPVVEMERYGKGDNAMTDLARGIERLRAEWVEPAGGYEYEESPGVRYRVGARSMQRLGAALAARGPDDVDPYSEWCTHVDAERA